jgi:hypothetical protein
MKRIILVVAFAGGSLLATSSKAQAWGGYHIGYTHVGPFGVQHYGRTIGVGPYGGVYGGVHVGAFGGVYRAGYGYGGIYGAGYYPWGLYGGYYPYAPYYDGGYAVGGYHYGDVYRAGVYRHY